MYMLSDIEPGGGALMVVPGSHKREVPYLPEGVDFRTASGNVRYEDLHTDEQRGIFTELTGKAGTAVIFTHDIIHQSASPIDPDFCLASAS